MMRYAYQGKKDTAGYTLGSSVWYSFLDNKNNNKTGSRMNANVFYQWATPTYDTTLTFGYQDIDNKQAGVNYSTFGSFDTEYHVANKAYYYVADIDYKTSWNYKDWKGFKPYLVFSGLMKQDGQPNSYRNIAGLQADYKTLLSMQSIFWRKMMPLLVVIPIPLLIRLTIIGKATLYYLCI